MSLTPKTRVRSRRNQVAKYSLPTGSESPNWERNLPAGVDLGVDNVKSQGEAFSVKIICRNSQTDVPRFDSV